MPKFCFSDGLPEVLTNTEERQKLYGIQIEIRRRSRCRSVIVWGAAVTYSTLGDKRRRAASLSFSVFEMPIEAGSDLLETEAAVADTVLDGRTKVISNIERFDGARTPFQQPRCQQRIPPLKPPQGELPEVNTAQ